MPLTHRKRTSTSSVRPNLDGPAQTNGAAAAAEEQLAAALTLGDEFGGGRLLVSDVRTTFLVMNYARLRAIARLFGVSEDQANLLTLVAAMSLAQAAQARVQRLLRGPPLPSLGGAMFTGTGVKELLCGVAGSPARDTPFVGTLLAAAILGASAGPVTVKSARAVKASSRQAALGFHHRYGYIVDPGHWRQRRARRVEAARG